MNEEKLIARKALREGLKEIGYTVTDSEIELFEKYMEGILSWNEKVNLTTITEPEEFVKKHYIDSLHAIKTAEFQCAETVLDIGTGGGFPGIPLAIICPEKKFVLVDSLAKRLKIIGELVEKLGIKNVTTIHGRFEDLGNEADLREAFDVVLSRAVAEMPVLAEYALPFVKLEGALIAYKTEGEKLDQELLQAVKAIKTLGGGMPRIKKAAENHVLVVVDKERKTPKAYPRKAGTPKKNPL